MILAAESRNTLTGRQLVQGLSGQSVNVASNLKPLNPIEVSEPLDLGEVFILSEPL
jgi:hypothetical protein